MTGKFRRPRLTWMIAVVISAAPLLLASNALWAGEKIRAVVSIAPHSYFVRAIGGDLVDVEILVPPGQSPATYEPTPGQLTRLADAQVLFTTGVPFEKRLLEKIAGGFEKLRIVRLHDGIKLRPIDGHEEAGHDHGEAGDPHVWLDPTLAIKQAETVVRVLSDIRPSDAAIFEDNFRTLRAQVDSVSSVVREMMAPITGRTMYVFHPSFGYFADAYGLHQVAVEQGGKEPSARQLANLIEQAGHDSVGVMFVQPQFSRKQAEAVGEAIGARIVTLDPLSDDYLNNLVDMASKIKQALSGDR